MIKYQTVTNFSFKLMSYMLLIFRGAVRSLLALGRARLAVSAISSVFMLR